MATKLSSSEIEAKLTLFNSMKSQAFEGDVPDVVKISEIVNSLNSIPKIFRSPFKEFAKSLRNESFLKGISINNINSDFFQAIEFESKETLQPVVNQTQIDLHGKVKAELQELIEQLNFVLFDDLEVLKDHFIIRLESNPFESYKLMVLHDPKFFIQPIKNKLSSKFNNVTFNEITEFLAKIEEGDELNNMLCLILLSPRTNDIEGIENLIGTLKSIISSYESFENISFNENSDSGSKYKKSTLEDDFFDEICFVNGTLLSNGKIKHEEEKIIKKLCSNFNTPLVIYKTLKEGNSGAKVIEVRPKKQFGSEHERRYIIKYAKLDDERKIKTEYSNFGSFIEGYKGFNQYECKYDKTLSYEGLRYSYAISDKEKNSYSLSQLIGGYNPDQIDINSSIDRLFKSELFNLWNESIESKSCKTAELFQNYINLDKSLEVISKILNVSLEDAKKTETVINFYKIWNHTRDFHLKVCHGDLHSENFFIDSNEYLIDFGFTGINHALIDHAALECSLKFKHFPFYIQEKELEEIELEFLLDDSFNLSYISNSVQRKDLIVIFDLIKQIRHHSNSLIMTDHKIEYFISLYLMTFRQIRYNDMNQFYALRSANLLGKHIVQLLCL